MMKKVIGVPKENKPQEFRVALTPEAVSYLIHKGFQVNITSDAGFVAGHNNAVYQQVGANVVANNEELYKKSDLIVKVKEPYGSDVDCLENKHTLFSYLHLAADETLTAKLQHIGPNFRAFAFESVQVGKELPLLKPMSEIAGKLSIHAAIQAMPAWKNGKGVLLGGVTGTDRGNVVVIGAGVAGYNAASVAAALGANVKVLDIDMNKLYSVQQLGPNVTGLYSSQWNIRKTLKNADVVVGAVLIPNKKAPWVVTEEMLSYYVNPGTVMVDISVDQGGCFETTKPTTHEKPTYEVGGVIHYAVTNMPGAMARTASEALSNAILPYVEILATGVEGSPSALYSVSKPLYKAANIDGHQLCIKLR